MIDWFGWLTKPRYLMTVLDSIIFVVEFLFFSLTVLTCYQFGVWLLEKMEQRRITKMLRK